MTKYSKSITNFFSKISFMKNQMRFYSENIRHQIVVENALQSLSPKFDMIFVTIKEAKDIGTLFIDKLMSLLLVHEQKVNRYSDETLEHAL